MTARWDADDELDDAQLQTMDKLWEACRHEGLSKEQAAEIEALVRSGQVYVARRRLGRARRKCRPT